MRTFQRQPTLNHPRTSVRIFMTGAPKVVPTDSKESDADKNKKPEVAGPGAATTPAAQPDVAKK